jgi:hypothetical protein
MCAWGTTTVLRMPGIGRPVGVDSCISDLVKALNEAGFRTVASCCGHGKRPGNIALADGRELIIAADYATGRSVDAAFPPINPIGRQALQEGKEE